MDDLLLYLHLASLTLAIVGIALADKVAFAWMRGTTETIAPAKLLQLHWIVTIALSGLVVTGLLMFWPLRDYLTGQPEFWIKMVFVLALLINSFFIEHFMGKAATTPFSSLTQKEKIPLFISGAVSGASWVGAAVVAYLLFGWPF